jgi:repressor LexA
MNQKPLHPAQRELLRLLVKHADDPLTVRDLQDRMGASSTSVVAHHLQALEKKGYLKRNPYNSREYQVLEGGAEAGIAYLNMYGLASCGPKGSILDGDPVDRIALASRLISFPVADAFLVKAKGRSMEPKIHEGDLIIARKTKEILEGKVCVCVNDGMAMIKLIRMSGRTVFLESFNREAFPLVPAHTDFHVEGEVRGIISGKIC